jgi:Peptidase family M41
MTDLQRSIFQLSLFKALSTRLAGSLLLHFLTTPDLRQMLGQQQTLSEATAQTIDAEVRRLVEGGLAEATKIITEKRQDLETLAKGLLEYETLTGEEIVGLLKGHAPVRDTGGDEPPLRGSPVPTTV